MLPNPLHRRSFIKALAATTALPPFWPNRLFAKDAEPALITRQQNPDNYEFPFASLNSFITPNKLFYVRSHFAVPKINPSTWRLSIVGAVNQELSVSLEDLRAMPTRAVTATLECSGNGRGLVRPPLRGVGWELGAVSNAEWVGVPLVAVLDKAGLRGAAVEVILEGTDKGVMPTEAWLGQIPFARSLPVAKARQEDVLLAFRMNGADLSASHGFPVRAIVPDWYGVSSVKWLQRITVSDRAFKGYFQALDYTVFERRDGLPQLAPITELQTKALIAQPTAGAALGTNASVVIHGAAWSASPVSRVDVSTDGGRSWQAARLVGKPVPHAWRLWELPWRTPALPGAVTLMARATDSGNRRQPMTRDADHRNYVVNHVLPVEVQIR
jgi:DMSO/TMAO reductase YedYZ molybdopterin-dependent catalytic subunit